MTKAPFTCEVADGLQFERLQDGFERGHLQVHLLVDLHVVEFQAGFLVTSSPKQRQPISEGLPSARRQTVLRTESCRIYPLMKLCRGLHHLLLLLSELKHRHHFRPTMVSITRQLVQNWFLDISLTFILNLSLTLVSTLKPRFNLQAEP